MKKFVQKTKKFLFKKFALSRTNERYIALPALKMAMQPMKTKFLLITVVFNDSELIQLQWHSLKKLTDAYDYLVVDDSSDEKHSTAIESFCIQQGVSYVHLPEPNPGLDASLCHGFALNWIFNNIVKKLNPEYFGILDPDIFLVASGSFLESWKGKSFWGVNSPVPPEQWRLPPGFSFFSRDFYQDRKLNFLPAYNVDSGLRFKFFEGLDISHLIPWESVEIRKIAEDSPESVQFFANVVHLVGGVSLKTGQAKSINRKREFAYRLILGVSAPTHS